MYPEKRRNEIIQILLNRNSCNVVDLVKRLNVSEETIRRDSRILQKQKIIKKTYGMISLLQNSSNLYVPTIHERKKKEKEEKIAIAKEAITMIKDNRFLLIDAGSTTEYLAELINTLDVYKKISLITNGLNIAYICSKYEINNLFIIGGILRPNTLSVVGPQAIKEVKSYNIDIAFMGATGISVEHDFCGFYSSNIYEVELKKTIVSAARVVVVVADHTKFGKHGLKPFCNFENVDYLITSDLLENSILDKLKTDYTTKLIIAKTTFNKSK